MYKRQEEIFDPIIVFTYLGFLTEDPTTAIILSALYCLFNIAFPIIERSGRFRVHIISPLLIGEVLLITVLKFPDG